MAKYISMLANGGNKIDVSIIKTIRKADGTEESRDNIKNFVKQKLGLSDGNTEDLNINKDNLQVVLEGMRSVTEEEELVASIFKDLKGVQLEGKLVLLRHQGNKR